MPSKALSEMKETDESVYSNFDHELNQTIVAKLQENPNKIYAQHAAWDFCGYIWFDGTLFHERVLRYHQLVAEEKDADIGNLIEKINDRWGYK